MNHKLLYVLLPLISLFFLLAQQERAFTQDLGRHIKTGEVILNCRCVPSVNYFSFTQSSHPFVNHHWLSEVVFYLTSATFGINSLIFLKIVFISASFFIVYFLAVRKIGWFWPSVVSVPYLYIFSERFDMRPELFSFLFVSLFLLCITFYREKRNITLLLPLLLIQLFWVNLHIYFIVGIIIFSFFVLEEWVIHKKLSVRLLSVWVGLLVVSFFNPQGMKGFLEPFIIFSNYGYSIVENQNIFFLNSVFRNYHIYIFEAMTVLLLVLLFFIPKTKNTFFILLAVFSVGASIKMIRNFPLFILGTFILLSYELFWIERNVLRTKRAQQYAKVIALGIAIVGIGIIIKNGISSPFFGFSYVTGAENGVEFLKKNSVHGPIFNNFDIGSYLIYRLYPQEKVFVDGRPEAYSVDFFNDYKKMQDNHDFFTTQAEKYKINTIFFAHTDITPWAQNFLAQVIQNPSWVLVYSDERIVIFVKNSPQNKAIIERHGKTL